MKKREYKVPAIKVVKFQQHVNIMAGSEGGEAGVRNYNMAAEEDW